MQRLQTPSTQTKLNQMKRPSLGPVYAIQPGNKDLLLLFLHRVALPIISIQECHGEGPHV